jgi:phosphate transport system permease protein
VIRALPIRLSTRRQPERFRVVTTVVSLAAPVVVLAIVVVLYLQAVPALTRFGAGFLVARAWNPVTLDFGALPFVYGTLLTSAIAIALALPIGLAVALILAEPGAQGLRGAVGTGVELLAAIPSVVFGIWALYVMAPFVFSRIEEPVSSSFGTAGVFAGPAHQTSLFTASLVLAIMILPTLSAISRDVLKAVPVGLRESAVALGATWWETTWKVVLPAARAGIFGATILALGRALGETIAVTMVIGNRPEISASIFAPAYTLASVIANEFTEATGQIYPSALIELGLVLILVTFAINVLALLLVRRTMDLAR